MHGLTNRRLFLIAPNRKMPIAKQLAIALHRFVTNGTGSSIGNVSALFGVDDGRSIPKKHVFYLNKNHDR